MTTTATASYPTLPPFIKIRPNRIDSIDFLRGVVMIIMALDHVRDYFHYDAFLYSPTDLSQTSVPLFLTRWITHFCAPVFVFLAGTSAYLYGAKKSKKELSFFLLTRGLFLLFIELVVLDFFRTFNPSFPYYNLQVIWAIGICMIALSAIIYLDWRFIVLIAVLLIAGHNLLDSIHVPGNNFPAFLWSFLHDVNHFSIGESVTVYVHYPVLPWIGLMVAGYCVGKLYVRDYNAKKRRRTLLLMGQGAILLFLILRSGNWYGDPSHWSVQKNFIFSMLSFLNVTKYPPSLLYILITIGPALIFLSLTEGTLSKWKTRVTIFGRTALFYYLAHILLIHLFALIGAVISGYSFRDMILSSSVNDDIHLKGYGYGFSLTTVYVVWIALVLVLYPLCKWFDSYKRVYKSKKKWLSYM